MSIGGAFIILVFAFLALCACVGLLLENLRLSARLEIALMVAQNRIKQGIEAMPVAVLYCDEHDRLKNWNESYESILGPHKSLLAAGLHFKDLLKRLAATGWVEGAADREDQWVEDRWSFRAQGEGQWESRLADGRCVQFVDRRIETGGFLLVGVDITNAKRGEASARLLFDTNPMPMWIWNPDTLVFTDSNAAAQDLFGWSAEEFHGKSVYDTLPTEEHQAIAEFFATGVPDQFETNRPWRHITADGSQVLIMSRHRRLPSSEPRLLLSALIDVTERVETEQMLRRREEELRRATLSAESANLAKSQFLANMSHEIRTPLNGVIAVADVLSHTSTTPAQAEMINLIKTSGDTLNRLLSDVLDLSRIESGELSLEERPFHLGEALREIGGLLGLKAQEKGLHFILSIAPDVDRVFVGDELRVKQIVTNILSNAVKFTSYGSVTLNARRAPDTQKILMDVIDTGLGFEAETAARLFLRFQQADGSVTRKFGGSGLGLSICRELVAVLNGDIGCESTPGEGSRFWVQLDLPEGDIAQVYECERSEFGDMALRVLVADDHPTNQHVARLVLAQVGAEVTAVMDGEAALQAFVGGRFDLILMDMQMPVRDGLSATLAIRQVEARSARPRTPIIMLTANATAEHVASSLSAGADLHLAKPFSVHDLLGAISSLVDQPQPETTASSA
jgi:PAS domain S-box-containing protein